jgi:hypothetical protein
MNRRVFLTGIAATVAGLSLPHWLSEGAALAQARYGRIVVDMGPLEQRGGRGAAAIIRPQLQASLQREFAGRLGGGPTLVVRVQTVLLSSAVPGGGGGFSSGGPSTDYLEAEIVVGSQRTPLLVTQDANVGGHDFMPENEHRRLRGLADSLAAWVRRYA